MKPTTLGTLLWIFLVSVLLLNGCYSPEEGCLDPEAKNYSITGDNECMDCCVYPTLDISIFHENQDTTFNLGDTIINDLGQRLILLDYAYLLSDFNVRKVDASFEVTNTVAVDIEGEATVIKDDVIRVDRGLFTFEIGTIIFDGAVDSLTFSIGLNDTLNNYRFTNEISNHPLIADPDSLYNEALGTYVFQRLRVAQGNDFTDTVVYDIDKLVEVVFPIDYVSQKGEDKTIIIEAQYNKWFDGIDFQNMTKEDILTHIEVNSAFVFREKDD